jgi:hypothetical protein
MKATCQADAGAQQDTMLATVAQHAQSENRAHHLQAALRYHNDHLHEECSTVGEAALPLHLCNGYVAAMRALVDAEALAAEVTLRSSNSSSSSSSTRAAAEEAVTAQGLNRTQQDTNNA